MVSRWLLLFFVADGSTMRIMNEFFFISFDFFNERKYICIYAFIWWTDRDVEYVWIEACGLHFFFITWFRLVMESVLGFLRFNWLFEVSYAASFFYLLMIYWNFLVFFYSIVFISNVCVIWQNDGKSGFHSFQSHHFFRSFVN